jgi:riboflavin kinase/FMN adenylyltransferase
VEVVRIDGPRAEGAAHALTVGNFDGVHRGHHVLLGVAREEARAAGVPPAVLTFDPHPARVLRPRDAPPPLTSLAQKAELLAALGVERLFVLPFTEAVAGLPAGRFAAEVLRDRLRARVVVVGEGFRFGRGRQGDVSTLGREGQRLGFRVRAVPPVLWEGVPVSSTRVREAVAAGKAAEARGLLGRSYFVDGNVTRGEGRGRGLGVPTANLEPSVQVWPARGVYAGRAEARADAGEGARPAVINVGLRPTFGGGTLSLEAHLLDFEGDLYGQALRLHFDHYLRAERAFPDGGALVRQIRRDVEDARRLLSAPLTDAL